MLNRSETRSLAQEEHRRRRQEKLFNKGIKDPGRCHFPCRHPASPPHLSLHTAQCSLSLFTYRSSELNQRNPCARAPVRVSASSMSDGSRPKTRYDTLVNRFIMRKSRGKDCRGLR